MKKVYLIPLFLIFTGVLFAQTNNSRRLLSDAMVSYGAKYQSECEKAMITDDMDRIKFLFDSITTYCLKGKYFDNFGLHKLSGKSIKMEDFEKPVVLITLSPWYISTEGEINAINDLASKYKNSIDFVVLFWGNKKEARKASKDFNSNVVITYFDEMDNKGAYVVGKLKHVFGFPTCYYMNADKSIVSITRGGTKKPFYAEQDVVYEENFNSHFVYVKELLVNAQVAGVVHK